MKANRAHWKVVMLLVVAAVIGLSCAKKKREAPMPEMIPYQNPADLFSISYPKGWFVQEDAQALKVYSSQEAMTKFLDFAASAKGGVHISIATKKLDTRQTLDQIVATYKAENQEAVSSFGTGGRTSLAGREAVELPYTIQIDPKTVIHGVRYFALQDSALYTVNYEAFNELFDEYKAVFDSTLKTVRFAKPRLTAAAAAQFVPSTTLQTYSAKEFDISYPDNFEYNFPKRSGDTEFLVEFKGVREDCILRVDISPAKKNPLDKVVEKYRTELQKLYNIKSAAETTLGGEKASYFNMSLRGREIDSRAYFLVKSDKVFYIFMSWYRPQANLYVPAFEKMVASMKLKV